MKNSKPGREQTSNRVFLSVSKQRADYSFGRKQVKGNNICHSARI